MKNKLLSWFRTDESGFAHVEDKQEKQVAKRKSILELFREPEVAKDEPAKKIDRSDWAYDDKKAGRCLNVFGAFLTAGMLSFGGMWATQVEKDILEKKEIKTEQDLAYAEKLKKLQDVFLAGCLISGLGGLGTACVADASSSRFLNGMGSYLDKYED